MKPNFEFVVDNYEFHDGDEVYVIDKNKVDIFKAKIDKVNKKGFSVTYTDHEEDGSKKVLTPKRLLLLTPANNAIYDEQQQRRKERIEKENQKNQEEKNEEANNDNQKDEEKNDSKEEQKRDEKEGDNKSEVKNPKPTKRVKRRKKVKKPLFDKQEIIKTAWHNGIHEVSQFQKYIKKNVKMLVSEFEKYHVMMNVADKPPFSLGLNLSESDITKFWTHARNQWKKLFDDAESINTVEFIRKTSSTYKLQNQMESNARDALQFFFDTESNSSNNETNFFQFCALLALFGPTQTMFRKIGHFFQCPPELKDSFNYNDVSDVNEPDSNIYLNEFAFFAGTSREQFFYNNPFAVTDEQYIMDEDGNMYDSWIKVFEHVMSEKVEEEAAVINSPPAIPIEAS